MWKRINQLFNWLPLAANIEGKILCMHGGIGRCIHKIDQIAGLKRPITMEEGGPVGGGGGGDSAGCAGRWGCWGVEGWRWCWGPRVVMFGRLGLAGRGCRGCRGWRRPWQRCADPGAPRALLTHPLPPTPPHPTPPRPTPPHPPPRRC